MNTTPPAVRRHADVAHSPAIGGRRSAPRSGHGTGTPLGLTASVDGFWDALESLMLARFSDGLEPFAVETQLKGVESLADIAPAGARSHAIVTDHHEKWLIAGDGWTFLGRRDSDGDVFVTITASTLDGRDAVLADVRTRVAPVEVDDETIPLSFWFFEQRARVSHRRVAAPAWSDIARNYPDSVRPRLDATMRLERPDARGRLLLWHGPPGTGKTTAARALARSWSDWCRTVVVAEPERLFSSAGLIFDLVAVDRDDDDASRWTLLVVEDADELLRADARSTSGQALSRLLNLADGFMGQGMEVLILLSTNERLGGLHPAVSRPGRCLSEIEFPRFGRTEATTWLGRTPSASRPDHSLAELVDEQHGRGGPAPAAPGTGTGQYL